MRRSLQISFLVGLLVLISSLVAAATSGAPPPAPTLTIDPASWDFGTTTVGTSSKKTFAVTFSGKGSSGPLKISRVGGDYQLFMNTTNDTCSGISLSSKIPACSVEVEFTPTSAGGYGTTLEIWGRKVSKTAALTGTGVAATPTLSINSPNYVYSNNSTPVVFTVTMSTTSTSNVTFDWAATNDTAFWGTTCDTTADYTSAAMTGSGTIIAGQTTTTITFGTCNNGPMWHPIKTPTYFTVTISNPTGATIAAATGTGTIRIT